MKTANQTNTCWRDLIVTRSTDLSAHEISRMGQFLNTIGNRYGGCTSVPMADGFLTAMLIGPACIPCNPHQGLEAVWGEMTNDVKTQRVVLASKSKREMVNYLNRLTYRASDALKWNRDSYSPHIDGDVFYGIDFCRDEDAVGSADGDPLGHESYVPTAIQWCRGFRKFVALTDQAWAPIFETEWSRSLIAPFMFFGDANGWSLPFYQNIA